MFAKFTTAHWFALRCLPLCLLVLGFLQTTFSQAQAADRALLIGVSQYKNAYIQSLPGVLNDLELMRELLVEGFSVPEHSIKELRDTQATHAGILDSIDSWLINGTRPGDRVFIHFSGHGSYLPDTDGDESGIDGDGVDEVLVAYDAECNAGFCKNMVLDDEIGERLEQLSDRYVITVFDSCNSGTATRSFLSGAGDRDQTTARLFRPETVTSSSNSQESTTRSMPTLQGASRGQIAHHKDEGGFFPGQINHINLSAVQSFQLALEVNLPGLPVSGLFTRSIYDALRHKQADLDANGSVSFAELDHHLSSTAEQFCQNHPRRCQLAGGVDPQMEVAPALIGKDVFQFGKSEQDGGIADLEQSTITSILAQPNEANIRIQLEPGTRLLPGDSVRFKVRADQSGLLFLFDLDASDNLTLLYPTDFTPSINGKPRGWVSAGSEVIIPDSIDNGRYIVEPPYGKGVVFAVLAEHINEIPSTRNFAVAGRQNSMDIETPVIALGELRLSLDRLVDSVDDDYLRDRSEWSMLSVGYEVLPR